MSAPHRGPNGVVVEEHDPAREVERPVKERPEAIGPIVRDIPLGLSFPGFLRPFREMRPPEI